MPMDQLTIGGGDLREHPPWLPLALAEFLLGEFRVRKFHSRVFHSSRVCGLIRKIQMLQMRRCM